MSMCLPHSRRAEMWTSSASTGNIGAFDCRPWGAHEYATPVHGRVRVGQAVVRVLAVVVGAADMRWEVVALVEGTIEEEHGWGLQRVDAASDRDAHEHGRSCHVYGAPASVDSARHGMRRERGRIYAARSRLAPASSCARLGKTLVEMAAGKEKGRKRGTVVRVVTREKEHYSRREGEKLIGEGGKDRIRRVKKERENDRRKHIPPQPLQVFTSHSRPAPLELRRNSSITIAVVENGARKRRM
ncbi:hypothetical protein B0H16DRAFT_1460222 [Mycena metata]|uniref:Uncharacterized protein n=1 Tax=Mycena metata TaxID=1033252 RepID=A0AAD7IW46_9AGAR|nr:hypothetical protein B0H16DRAFT_1460222 [Mycena metata]